MSVGSPLKFCSKLKTAFLSTIVLFTSKPMGLTLYCLMLSRAKVSNHFFSDDFGI